MWETFGFVRTVAPCIPSPFPLLSPSPPDVSKKMSIWMKRMDFILCEFLGYINLVSRLKPCLQIGTWIFYYFLAADMATSQQLPIYCFTFSAAADFFPLHSFISLVLWHSCWEHLFKDLFGRLKQQLYLLITCSCFTERCVY